MGGWGGGGGGGRLGPESEDGLGYYNPTGFILRWVEQSGLRGTDLLIILLLFALQKVRCWKLRLSSH